jgi:hypothetical protein
MDYNACKLLCWRLRSAGIVQLFARFSATLKASPRLSNILHGLSVRVLICASVWGRAQGCGGRRGAGGGRDLLRGAGVRAAADGRVGAAGPPRAMCLMRCGKSSTRIAAACPEVMRCGKRSTRIMLAAACPLVTALSGRPHALCTHHSAARTERPLCREGRTRYARVHIARAAFRPQLRDASACCACFTHCSLH